MQNDELNNLNIGRASKYLGVSIDTLRRWEKKGKLVAYRSPGGHRYFKKEDLDKLFNTRYERNTNSFPNTSYQEDIQIKTNTNLQSTEEFKEISAFEESRQNTTSPENLQTQDTEHPTPEIKIVPIEPITLNLSQDTNLNQEQKASTPLLAETELQNKTEEKNNINQNVNEIGIETHTHLPIPEETLSFTIHPQANLELPENPKPELPAVDDKIVLSSDTPKSLENESDFSLNKPETKEEDIEKAAEDFPKESILPPQVTNTYKLDELEEKPWKHVPVDTVPVQNTSKPNLSDIVEPAKPKKQSKFVAYAIWAILFFSIIDLVMFFLWFSSTKIISPIP